jgi:hypothetical protein
MALPALTEAYHTRGNVPVAPNNTTATLIHQFVLWSIKAFLMDNHSAGTTSGTRNSNSVWTCLGSSDGTTGALDAVDRWGTSFNASKIVLASSGTAHSWIVLRNAANGYDLCIDCNTTSFGHIGLSVVKSSQGFVSPSNTTRPAATGSSEEFMLGTTNLAPSSNIHLFADGTTSLNHYVHFATNADGSRFWWGISRASTGILNGGFAFWKGANGRAGDTRNQWLLRFGPISSGRGSGAAGQLTQTYNVLRRGWGNTAPPTLAGPIAPTFGGGSIAGTGMDSATNDYLVYPMPVAVPTSPPLACGYLPDLQWVSGGAIASNIPSAAAQERTIIGDIIVPCGVGLTV